MSGSLSEQYTERLVRLEGARWKRLLPNPYRWHIRRRCTGTVLDVGCGIGRCLAYLSPRPAVGVDPNAASVDAARSRGLAAFTPAEFAMVHQPSSFDTLLCSHVLEHMTEPEAADLLRSWLPYLRDGGRAVVICPQERGQASDATHVTFLDADQLTSLASRVGLRVERVTSFPLPRRFGRWWVHNESVLVAARNV